MPANRPARIFATGPILGSAPITSGTPISPGRAILISATAAAEVTVTLYSDNSEVPLNPVAGDNIYPFSVVLAVVTSGTVTMTNLY